jgi:hypothetical protein
MPLRIAFIELRFSKNRDKQSILARGGTDE